MHKRLMLVVIFIVVSVAIIANAQDRRGQQFSDWSRVEHLPPPINSEFSDQAPLLSRDEKTLYFTSNRPGGSGGEDIWVSTRKNRNSPWKTPVNLGPTINTPGIERLRSLTSDGRVLLFMSDRAGGSGSTDIWAVARKHANHETDWGTPVNLGTTINSGTSELAAKYLFADAGRLNKLFFTSARDGGFGGTDLYESNIVGGEFETPINVIELNSTSFDTCFWMRDDGLEILFVSNRPDLSGDLTYTDLWTATRDSIFEPWSAPVRLGPNINSSGYMDVNPSLSDDGETMFFASKRPGGIGPGTFDIYLTTRERK